MANAGANKMDKLKGFIYIFKDKKWFEKMLADH